MPQVVMNTEVNGHPGNYYGLGAGIGTGLGQAVGAFAAPIGEHVGYWVGHELFGNTPQEDLYAAQAKEFGDRSDAYARAQYDRAVAENNWTPEQRKVAAQHYGVRGVGNDTALDDPILYNPIAPMLQGSAAQVQRSNLRNPDNQEVPNYLQQGGGGGASPQATQVGDLFKAAPELQHEGQAPATPQYGPQQQPQQPQGGSTSTASPSPPGSGAAPGSTQARGAQQQAAQQAQSVGASTSDTVQKMQQAMQLPSPIANMPPEKRAYAQALLSNIGGGTTRLRAIADGKYDDTTEASIATVGHATDANIRQLVGHVQGAEGVGADLPGFNQALGAISFRNSLDPNYEKTHSPAEVAQTKIQAKMFENYIATHQDPMYHKMIMEMASSKFMENLGSSAHVAAVGKVLSEKNRDDAETQLTQYRSKLAAQELKWNEVFNPSKAEDLKILTKAHQLGIDNNPLIMDHLKAETADLAAHSVATRVTSGLAVDMAPIEQASKQVAMRAEVLKANVTLAEFQANKEITRAAAINAARTQQINTLQKVNEAALEKFPNWALPGGDLAKKQYLDNQDQIALIQSDMRAANNSKDAQSLLSQSLKRYSGQFNDGVDGVVTRAFYSPQLSDPINHTPDYGDVNFFRGQTSLCKSQGGDLIDNLPKDDQVRKAAVEGAYLTARNPQVKTPPTFEQFKQLAMDSKGKTLFNPHDPANSFLKDDPKGQQELQSAYTLYLDFYNKYRGTR